MSKPRQQGVSRTVLPDWRRWVAAATLAGLLVAWLGAAVAAPADERERLAIERRAAAARYAEARDTCRAKYFVNGCLEAARTQQRLALDGLRQQQLLLDDARRRERAAERSKLRQDRAQAQAVQASTPVLRQPRQAAAEAGAASAGTVASVSVSVSVSTSTSAPVGRPAAASAPHVATSERQRQQAFDQRQLAAQAHQRAVEARLARQDAARPPTTSLPTPAPNHRTDAAAAR